MNDDINFKFKAYADGDSIIVHVKVDGAEAKFMYTDEESVAMLASNMKYILDYALEDYTLNKKFKAQIDNDLEGWLNDGNDS